MSNLYHITSPRAVHIDGCDWLQSSVKLNAGGRVLCEVCTSPGAPARLYTYTREGARLSEFATERAAWQAALAFIDSQILKVEIK